MSLISRRRFLKGVGAFGVASATLGSYAFAVEPGFMLNVTAYEATPPGWPADFALRVAVIADIHACEPYMSAARVRNICALAQSLKPDVAVILGDFNGGHDFVTAPVLPEQWAEALTVLNPPLGAYAVLGNHDWWHGPTPRMRGDETMSIRKSLAYARVKLLDNDAVRLVKHGRPFWVAGLADQIAHRVRRGVYRGLDDIDRTLGLVTDDAPVLMLAHEPFAFARMPARVSLTFCGHTHGGQVNLPIIGSPFAERRFGKAHVYGHVVEDERHMIISAGLGTSILPARLGRPPEIVMVELGAQAIA